MHPWIFSKFKASLQYRKFCLQTRLIHQYKLALLEQMLLERQCRFIFSNRWTLTSISSITHPLTFIAIVWNRYMRQYTYLIYAHTKSNTVKSPDPGPIDSNGEFSFPTWHHSWIHSFTQPCLFPRYLVAWECSCSNPWHLVSLPEGLGQSVGNMLVLLCLERSYPCPALVSATQRQSP